MKIFPSSIGFHFTDEAVYIAYCQSSRTFYCRKKLKTCCSDLCFRKRIALEKGLIVRGKVQDSAKLGGLLKEYLYTVRSDIKTHNAVLCLSPDKVYYSTFQIPKSKGKDKESAVLEKTYKIIPEDAKELHLITKDLAAHNGLPMVGVSAINKNLLQGYLDAITVAGLEVAAVTTSSSVLASLIPRKWKKRCYILIDTASGASDLYSVTLFCDDWPAVEVMVPKGSREKEDIRDAVRHCIKKEHDAGGYVQTVCTLDGVSAEVANEMFASPPSEVEPEQDRSRIPSVRAIEKDVLGIQEIGPEWAAALGASIMKFRRFVYYRPSFYQVKRSYKIVFIIAGILLFGLASFYIFNKLFPLVTNPQEVCYTAEDLFKFSDATPNHPYHQGILWGVVNDVLAGYPDGTFKPKQAVTRAEFLKIAYTVAGLDTSPIEVDGGFPDVDPEEWYAPFVQYALGQGIIEGYPDGTFRPESPVTFAEGLKMAYKSLRLPVQPLRTDEWFQKYLSQAAADDILFDITINPHSKMLRQDVIWSIWKMMGGVNVSKECL